MAIHLQPEDLILYSESPAPPPLVVPPRRSRLLLLLGLVPVLAYAGYVWRWAFNAPLMDDITLVNSVNRFVDDGLSDLASILLEQLNDHRIVFSRVAALVSFGLNGYLNVRAMALVGYANLLLLGWLLWRLFRTTGLKPAYFLPVPFLLFSPHLYQISLWGLVSFQPPLATAFSLASLLVLDHRRHWGWAMPLAAMALLAGGNGLVVFAAGTFLLAVQRRGGHLAGWGLFTFLALAGYFHGYRFSAASQVPDGLVNLLETLFVNTAVFAGSYLTVFSESKAVPLSLVLGSGVILASVGLLLRNLVPTAGLLRLFPKPTSGLLLAALFNLLGTAALIALARSSAGSGEMTSDRFHLYSTVLLIVFYLVLVGSLAGRYRRWLLRAVLPLAVMANAYAYLQYRPIRDTLVEGMAADAYNFTHHGVFLHQFPDFSEPQPEAYRHARFPATFAETDARQLQQLALRDEPRLEARTGVNLVQRPAPYRQEAFPYLDLFLETPPTAPVPGERVWLFLVGERRENGLFLLAARRQKAPLAEFLRTGRFYTNRFFANVSRKMPAGRYRLGLCWFENGRVTGRCAPGEVRL